MVSKVEEKPFLSHPYLNYEDIYNVTIKGTDGTVIFPIFLKKTFSEEMPKSVPYSRETLSCLLYFVERLVLSARNSYGKSEPILSIDNKTIFVGPLVKLSQKSSTVEKNTDLGTLFNVAAHLKIHPLMNLFASHIADRIFPLHTTLSLALKPFGIKEKEHHGIFQKHLRLKEMGVSEFSVADFLGLFGQPKIEKNILDLSFENLTSLAGLNLLYAPTQVEELILENNSLLLDDFIPITEHLESLTNLKKLRLSGNKLPHLPLHLFKSLKNIQITL